MEVESYFKGSLKSLHVPTNTGQHKNIKESVLRLTSYFVTEVKIEAGNKLSSANSPVIAVFYQSFKNACFQRFMHVSLQFAYSFRRYNRLCKHTLPYICVFSARYGVPLGIKNHAEQLRDL